MPRPAKSQPEENTIFTVTPHETSEAFSMETSPPENSSQWLQAILQEERIAMEQRHELLLKGLSMEGFEGRNLQKAELKQDEATRPANLQQESGEVAVKTDTSEARAPDDDPIDVSKSEGVVSTATSSRNRRSRLQETFGRQVSQTLEELEASWDLSQLVRTSKFEIFFCVIIVLNAIFMAVECQYIGLNVGFDLQFRDYNQSAQDTWPGAQNWFAIFEFIFGVFFSIEVCLKMAGLKKAFWRSLWNWFDLALVLFWALETSLQGLSPFVETSVLRLVRLLRLLRLLRLVRKVQGFDSLVIMTTALRGSLMALFWVAIVLLIVQMMFALLLTHVLTGYASDDSRELDDRKRIFKYFGTFARSMLTMFEITLGNWVPVARALQEAAGEPWVVFSIAHKISFGFACIGVINGAFMQETFKAASSDDFMLMRSAEAKKKLHVMKMNNFLEYGDQSGDGRVSQEEWKDCVLNEHIIAWFAGQGLSLRDADAVFGLLETDGSGSINAAELVDGVSRLQGPARALDLAMTQNLVFQTQKEIHAALEDLSETHAQLRSLLTKKPVS